MQTIHITANSRLTSALKQSAIIKSQAEVVQTPKAMTLAQWWQEWQNQAMLRFKLPSKPLPKKVLSTFEAQWLFEKCLNEVLKNQSKEPHNELNQVNQLNNGLTVEIENIALLNISATAKQLYQAWTLVCEYIPDWQQDGFLAAEDGNAESAFFKQVLEHYLHTLEQKNWQDENLFALTRLQWLQEVGKDFLPAKFQLHGFDDLTPHIKSWRKIALDFGSEVNADTVFESKDDSVFKLDLSSLKQALVYYAAKDKYDEVQQVACWANQQLHALLKQKSLGQIRIGIVAADVNEYKTLLTQALDEHLLLNGLGQLNLEQNQASKIYNISLGEPLLNVPLIANAMQTLQLMLQPQKRVAYDEWSRWLISPYTAGDLTQRQQADAEFRRLQWAQLSWSNLLSQKAAQALPTSLKQNLENWLQKTSQANLSKLSLPQFMDWVQQALSELQWPGNRTLTSSEYQQKTALENSLTAFSGLSEIQAQQTVSGWLSLLQRFLAEQVHQPQSVGYQPIQIMGMLEAGGQDFDALWVLGLTDEAWPRLANPNPFIPIRQQRDLAMPRSDSQRELGYAQNLSQRLVDSTAALYWSYPKQSGEAMLMSTSIFPCTKAQSEFQVVDWQPQTYQSLAQALFNEKTANATDFWELDEQGLPLEKGAKAPGGSGILQAQNQCPLMAYIDYRLGAKYGFQQVEDSLQNTNQGSLVHKVLEGFWQEMQTQVRMLALSPEALAEKLTNHIEAAFDELQMGLSSGIQQVETARILELCLEWLQLESKRESFAVIETEKEHVIELAGIEFKIVIDRVDSLLGVGEATQEKFILDYKTGRASIKDLINIPLKAPQLALYLFAMDDKVAGIGYGLLHSDDGVKLNAVVEHEELLGEVMHKKSRSLTVFAKEAEKEQSDYYQASWQDFLDHLKTQVLELAEQIQRGEAAMRFEKISDLQYASGYLALRVPEVVQQCQAAAGDSAQVHERVRGAE